MDDDNGATKYPAIQLMCVQCYRTALAVEGTVKVLYIDGIRARLDACGYAPAEWAYIDEKWVCSKECALQRRLTVLKKKRSSINKEIQKLIVKGV